MKIAKKVLIVLVLACIIINITQVESQAALSWDGITKDAKQFINAGKNQDMISDDSILDLTVSAANILTAVGAIVIVVALIVMGIKFITATPEEAAKIKQQLIGVIVAGVVIFGAVTIWKIMFDIMENVSSSL